MAHSANSSTSSPSDEHLVGYGIATATSRPRHDTMRAVMWEGKPYHMVVRTIPRPRITGPNDILVRLTTAAICGSDLHTYHGLLGGSDVPYTMGHEGVGVVTAVGTDVTNYKPGDRVVIFGGGSNTADGTYLYGEGNIFGQDEGGLQAEYALAPHESYLQHLPEGIDELDYVLLSDVFATAYDSISKTGFQPGDTVLVYGAGPVGLLAAYSALLRGASTVYVADRVEARLQRAKSIGAIPIDFTKGAPSEQVLKFEPSGVNRVSDCVGYEAVNAQGERDESYVLNDAIKAVSPGGGIALTGVYWAGKPDAGQPLITRAQGVIPFDVAAWWQKGATIAGGFANIAGPDPALMKLIRSGRAKPGEVVFDRIVGIEEVPEAYRLFDEKKVEKVAIRFPFP